MDDVEDLELSQPAAGSSSRPVRKKISLKLKKCEPSAESGRKGGRVRKAGKRDHPPPVVDRHLTDESGDDIDLTSISGSGPPEPTHQQKKLDWAHTVNMIGEKVVEPLIHCCQQCFLPIFIYGRMIPCKHVFCFDCAKNAGKNCPRCNGGVGHIEQAALGTVFVCTIGGTKHGVSGCHRTYLSQRDLQAHINYRHRGEAPSEGGDMKAAAAVAERHVDVHAHMSYQQLGMHMSPQPPPHGLVVQMRPPPMGAPPPLGAPPAHALMGVPPRLMPPPPLHLAPGPPPLQGQGGAGLPPPPPMHALAGSGCMPMQSCAPSSQSPLSGGPMQGLAAAPLVTHGAGPLVMSVPTSMPPPMHGGPASMPPPLPGHSLVSLPPPMQGQQLPNSAALPPGMQQNQLRSGPMQPMLRGPMPQGNSMPPRMQVGLSPQLPPPQPNQGMSPMMGTNTTIESYHTIPVMPANSRTNLIAIPMQEERDYAAGKSAPPVGLAPGTQPVMFSHSVAQSQPFPDGNSYIAPPQYNQPPLGSMPAHSVGPVLMQTMPAVSSHNNMAMQPVNYHEPPPPSAAMYPPGGGWAGDCPASGIRPPMSGPPPANTGQLQGPASAVRHGHGGLLPTGPVCQTHPMSMPPPIRQLRPTGITPQSNMSQMTHRPYF